ncbi:CD164 sialomucin-like 2 protein [Boleophthalmus pectinirostris]|uniref:CD164 sialomucin-like 2 protein n=1 Tax=Boleophthalmus pectinirostris TaxID=150288 RepID=UPI00242CFA74|nr:CD164 sialomucin-like 2 protein [Boleophthalmus pectinirostris]
MQRVAFKIICSCLLLFVAVNSVYSQADCSQAESCDLCVGASLLNLTGCVWRLCPDDNDTGVCMKDRGDVADDGRNCSWTRVSELCLVVETLAEDGNDADRDSNPKPAPEFSQAKFDMSSFIGGIILVLCVQAGGFFAMRFLKSKEQSNYETIEQPQ